MRKTGISEIGNFPFSNNFVITAVEQCLINAKEQKQLTSLKAIKMKLKKPYLFELRNYNRQLVTSVNTEPDKFIKFFTEILLSKTKYIEIDTKNI